MTLPIALATGGVQRPPGADSLDPAALRSTTPLRTTNKTEHASPTQLEQQAAREAFSNNPLLAGVFQPKVYDVAVACHMLEETAFVADEGEGKTCPGLFMVIRTPSQEPGKYRLVSTDGLGKGRFANFEKTATGYTNGSLAPTFEKLVEHLCADMKPQLGSIVGIPYFRQTEALTVLKRIQEADVTTGPVYEIFVRKDDTRLILAWKDAEGQVHAAHIHYVHPKGDAKGYFNNGGPAPMDFLPAASGLPPPPSPYFKTASAEVALKVDAGFDDGIPRTLHLDDLVHQKAGYDARRLLYLAGE